MTVSVLVPVYGVEKYIARCAESLFGQTYDDMEFIFVDDCSPDDSIRILNNTAEKFPARKPNVKILTHEHNRGVSAARNTALAAASGEYVMFVDSDDYLEPECVQKTAEIIDESDADAVLFGLKHLFKDKTVAELHPVCATKNEYTINVIERRMPVGVCGGVYRRELFTEEGIAFIDGLAYGEDYAAKALLLHKSYKTVSMPCCLYNYIHYNDSSSTRIFKVKDIDDQIAVLDILKQHFGNIYPEAVRNAAARIKAGLLKRWGTGNGDKTALERIKKIDAPTRNIPLQDRMTLAAAAAGAVPLRAYARIGVKVKHLFK